MYILELKCPSEILKSFLSAETVKNIGAISTPFTEAESCDEPAELFSIREVTHKDVISKHFTDWFFAMDDWAGITQKEFPFWAIIHSDEISVYGYFNDEKLNGIIRVDECDDNYELSFFFVNKALQQQGIGQRLFQYVLKRFDDKELTLYVYTDNDPALHIYIKYGFKITGIAYGIGYKPTLPHFIMQKDAG
jgi:ribosomal protein S18 acetylase RimI-like enzyme